MNVAINPNAMTRATGIAPGSGCRLLVLGMWLSMIDRRAGNQARHAAMGHLNQGESRRPSIVTGWLAGPRCAMLPATLRLAVRFLTHINDTTRRHYCNGNWPFRR